MDNNNVQNTPEEEQDIAEIFRVRREKLSGLRESGNDPFSETK